MPQAHSCWMCAYAMLHNSSDLDTIDSFNMRVPSLWQSGRIHTRPGINCLLLFHGCHGHTTCSLPDYRPTSHRSRRDSRSERDWTGPYEYARPRLAPHGRHQFRGQPFLYFASPYGFAMMTLVANPWAKVLSSLLARIMWSGISVLITKVKKLRRWPGSTKQTL